MSEINSIIYKFIKNGLRETQETIVNFLLKNYSELLHTTPKDVAARGHVRKFLRWANKEENFTIAGGVVYYNN